MAFALSKITIRSKPEVHDINIYILTNGVHTDLVLPVKTGLLDWSKKVSYANTVGRDTMMQYLAFGWGDKRFYMETPTWADLKFSTSICALSGLDQSAIHATYYKYIYAGKDCVKIGLSSEQYGKLVHYIDKTFMKDSTGHYLHIKTGANYGNTDAFYDANGHYNPFYTCNTWVNNGLKACGQKACFWTPFESGIFKLYRKGK